MSPLASQLAVLPILLVIMLALILVGVDLTRSIRRRVDEDNPDLRSVSLLKPGRPTGRSCRHMEGTGSSGWRR